ncbi:putative disease resistance protein At4g27220 isoform X2 [Tasmannia lanceolata]|uniref:putative disease resistance protein At4g27220 isoform X2 n=1 Tax=Tasmannia lanceolata TaxID=3420 RepID=UPI004063908A
MAAVASLILQVAKISFGLVKRRVDYLVHCEKSVEKLQLKAENLRLTRDDVRQSVDAATRNGEEITRVVQLWLQQVDDIGAITERLEEGTKENKRCFKGWCPNFSSRYSLGREATKKMVDVDVLLAKGNFTHVSTPRPCPSFNPAGEFEAFESAESAKELVIKALKEEGINIIGVYGMGGVGKTTLVEQVGKQAKDKKLCDEVVKVTVSQNQDLKKIQGELAEKLGLKFEENNEEMRAGLLLKRLKQEKKILIILDDLWDRLDLTKVGIPCGGTQKGCQIIITTRRLDLCSMMNCEKKIEVQLLPEQDSWNMFKEKAEIVETDELQSLAREVAKECKGLPLAIVTVARALKGRGSSIWANALQELKRSSPRNIEGVDKEVYSRLELSYNYIESEEAKLCFLFCCVFPEDHNIEVGVLMRYMMGERVFSDVNNFEEAWDRIHTLVEKLKDSCLLLDSDTKGCVKMHDVVRDVAILIASRKEHGFLVKVGLELTEWPENLDECKRLSLMGTSIGMLPEPPNCSRLSTLLLQQMNGWEEIPNNFIEGMKVLVVLDLSNSLISSLPPSLPYLKNLKTLCLDECSCLDDISLLGGLEKLEVLSVMGTAIRELPIEIAQLSNLKVLDLTGSFALTMVAPNVISRLTKLEELYMGNSFDEWEVRGSSGDGSKASFDEAASLARLTVLYIHVKDVKCLSLEVPGHWEKLKKFRICVWEGDYSFSDYEKCTSINIISYPISKWVKLLLERSEEIDLKSVSKSNIVHLLDDEGVSFNSVKRLNLYHCDEMEHFINTVEESHWVPPNAFRILQRLDLECMKKLEKICHGPLPIGFFGNLTDLNICRCRKLKNILSYDLLEGLKSLEKLRVVGCKELEEVFDYEEGMREEDHAAITTSPLSTLKKMELFDLPKLSCIWKGAIPPTGTFHNLTRLNVIQCDTLRCLFSPVLAQCLQQLEELYVSKCLRLEKIISEDEEVMLANKTRQDFSSLPPPLTFQNLGTISIQTCPRLKDVFSWNIARGLQQLESLCVRKCEEIEVIISGEELGVVDKETLLPRLETIELFHLPKLTSLCCHLNRGGGSHVFLHFPSFISIWVYACPNLKRFPVRPHNAHKLEMIQGEEAWFQGLEWEDEGYMSRLQPLFHPFQESDDEGGESDDEGGESDAFQESDDEGGESDAFQESDDEGGEMDDEIGDSDDKGDIQNGGHQKC